MFAGGPTTLPPLNLANNSSARNGDTGTGGITFGNNSSNGAIESAGGFALPLMIAGGVVALVLIIRAVK